ncbi:unnamed protein product [Ectocarpus sp. 6 AP-2014]
MPLLIPVAKNKASETVTPTCSKGDRPFTCLGCAKPLVLRQGEKKRWHFAHHSKDNDECSAGGETYVHLAAKLLLVTHITRFQFVAKCGRLRHAVEKQYHGCTAVQEHLYDGVHPRTWPCCAPGSWRLSLRSWRRARPRENRWRPE